MAEHGGDGLTRPIGRAVTAGAVTAGLVVVGSFVSFVARGDGLQAMFEAWLLHNGPVGLVGTAVMAAALHRQPRNRAAWLLYASSLAGAVHVGLMAVVYALADHHPQAWASIQAGTIALRDVPGALMWPLWVTSWLWLVSAGLAVTLALLFFPDGRLPGPRWRPAVRAATAGLVLAVAGYAWGNRPWSAHLVDRNGPGSGDTVAGVLAGVGLTLLGAATLAAVGSLVVRLRTAAPHERARVRPVVITGSLAASCLVVLWPWRTVWAVVGVPAIVLFVLTVGASVARHRLFDVEVVVSRAVVVTSLGAFVTLGYVVLVATVGLLVGSDDSLLTSVIATAAIAVSFDPVRRRVGRWARQLVTGARATPREVLEAVGQQLGGASSTPAALAAVGQVLVDGTGAAAVAIRSADSGLDLVVGASPADPAVRSAPITYEGDVLGELVLLADREDRFTPNDGSVLVHVAGALGPVLRAARLTHDLEDRIVELRASRRRLVTAQDHARRSLERDIHDGAQQELVAVRLALGLAQTLAEQGDTAQAGAAVEDATRRTEAAIRSLRDLARGLHPPILEEQGLVAALRAQARSVPLLVRIDADGVGRLERELEGAVYLCCLEALQNATKHAQASRVTVTFACDQGVFTFRIEDDGRGFRPEAEPPGSGLTNMRDRIDSLGGMLTIRSAPGRGTTVAGRVPVVADTDVGQSAASAR